MAAAQAPSGDLLLRGRLVAPDGVLPDGVLAAGGGRITWVGPAHRWAGGPSPSSGSALPPVTTLPPGLTLLPGLVDVHCHGGGGHGFPDADADGVLAAAAHHRGQGTTALLASLVSAPVEVVLAQVGVLAALVEAGDLAGTHLEGPFLSPQHCGAQDPGAVLAGDPGLLAELLDAGRGTVRSVTLAPETARSSELRALLAGRGVLASLGHTGAPSAAVRRWVADWVAQAGRPVGFTHLFNAMPPWSSRAPGPVAAALAAAARGEAVVELVADGVHLDDATVAAVFDLVGPGRVALVTDAMAAAGMPDGRYRLGRAGVDVVGGVARRARTAGAGPGTSGGGDAGGGDPPPIAGGTARLLDVVRRVVTRDGVDLADAVTAAAATPARLLGLDAERGALQAGRRADLLVVDEDLAPVAVAVGGRWVPGPPRTQEVLRAQEVPWRS